MVSLPEELGAREAAARRRVEELQAEAAELAFRLDKAREDLSRLEITRETVVQVLAELSTEEAAGPNVALRDAGTASDHRGEADAQRAWLAKVSVDALPSSLRDLDMAYAALVASVSGKRQAAVWGCRCSSRRKTREAACARCCGGMAGPRHAVVCRGPIVLPCGY
ncbi:hypothetical protein [Streptomyces melanogenes]|uniref:hypothetical protein n=1 Tax=Streptomyces melanogenes TaxID=67326 RepID=UPI00167ED7DB|nr:hypothetical protein [Streptomyces melanogenes]GGP93769.1 hypothetical protein GCM10010278_84740 [Streptomyces melanogenes]